MKQLRRNHNVAGSGETLGDVSDMRVDAEGFLKNKEAARGWRALGPRGPGTQRGAVAGGQLHPLRSHRHIESFGLSQGSTMRMVKSTGAVRFPGSGSVGQWVAAV